jgi:NAD(P)-dependent dehydrogenase (short-subunit alcohol dehydrogenase family)
MLTLNNHVILITGAGGGLGSTAALALAKHGAHIILLDKIISKMEQVYDKIVAAGGVEPTMYPFDLAGATEENYQELADVLLKEYGSLQGLLHSANDLSAFSPVETIRPQEWNQTLNVNLNAPFLLTQKLLPVLQKSEQAAIVFTSDDSIQNFPAYKGAYGVSKIALEGFAKTLAAESESRKQLRVNILHPGKVDSPLRKKAYPAEDKTQLASMDSLDDLYVYLFSDQSLGVTGQTFSAHTFKNA